MTAFFIVGVVGVVILVLSVLLGDLLAVFDIGDGLISGASVGAGLTFFGVPGYLTLMNGGPLWLAFVLAAGLAAVAMLVIQKMTLALAKSSAPEAEYTLIGLAGITTETTSATVGEVQLSHPREINKRLAFSSGPIAAGTSVIVTEVHGSKVKIVPSTEGPH